MIHIYRTGQRPCPHHVIVDHFKNDLSRPRSDTVHSVQSGIWELGYGTQWMIYRWQGVTQSNKLSPTTMRSTTKTPWSNWAQHNWRTILYVRADTQWSITDSPVLYVWISLQWPCVVLSHRETFSYFPCSTFLLAQTGLHILSPFWVSVTTFNTDWQCNNLIPSSFYPLQYWRWGKTFLQNVGIHKQNYELEGSHFIWQLLFITSCQYSAMHVVGWRSGLYSYNK
jgi:hypothetical protein